MFLIFLLATGFVFVASPYLIPRFLYDRFYLRPKREREAEELRRIRKQEADELQKRIEAWKESNPPVLYYNAINGVTAVMTKADYDEAVLCFKRAVRDGRLENCPVMAPSPRTYIYCHTSAKNVPDTHKRGWLSDFDDLKKKTTAVVSQRKDIFVPFVSESIMSFDDQAKIIWKVRDPQISLERRAEEARAELLRVSIPNVV